MKALQLAARLLSAARVVSAAALFAPWVSWVQKLGTLLGAFYWLASERFFRTSTAQLATNTGEKGHTLNAATDKNTTVLNFATASLLQAGPGLLALASPLLPPGLAASTLTSTPVIAALAAIALGACWLRFASMAALGDSFSTSLRTREGQAVVSSGPYAVVRHPGYLANGLLFFSTSLLTAGSPLLTGVWVVLFGAVWHVRIRAEEAMMRAALPAYKDYCSRVRARMVPGLY